MRVGSMAVCTVLLLAIPVAAEEDMHAWLEKNSPALLELYRDLHAHPELSFQEQQTAAKLAKEWRAAGYEVTSGVGGHGVVGLLENGAGPTLMLRTDLDALPVTETTGLVYSSKVQVADPAGAPVGVMHACGHDLHMANLTGVAKYMAEHKEHWRGTLMLVGQPAEERGSGASAMLDDGLFRRFPKPDFALALHVDAVLPVGQVGIRGGYAMANVNSVDIVLHGKGGHGAYPHTTIDPIVQAAELVMSLQTIVSREVKPTEPAVITVGAIHGGAKHNVIGDSCHLQLTVRSYGDEVRQQLLDAIERKAKAVAQGARAPEPTITITEGTPSLKNDEQLAGRISRLFAKLLGAENVAAAEPSMGGEDFSQYGRAGVPILMYKLGSVDGARLARWKQLGQEPPSLHSANYYPDVEAALPVGVRTLVAAALELMPVEAAAP